MLLISMVSRPMRLPMAAFAGAVFACAAATSAVGVEPSSALASGPPARLPTALADTLARAATTVTRPDQAALLGIAAAGERLVAVGERGLIVVSDDQAKSWHQVPVPVSVTLTAVSFATPTKGWAVGHRGVILVSSDAGHSWSLQLDGRRFAEAALKQMKAAAPALDAASEAGKSDPGQRALAEAEALVREGADKPFLSLSFADDRHGLAVGAYGLCARTDDGGASWASCMAQLPNPKSAHLYAIARDRQNIYIAGEQGLLLRSGDAGAHYAAVAGPYTTSLFCIGIAGNGDVVLGSLRGTAFVSTDAGRRFEALPSDSPGSCSGAARTGDGRVFVVNQLGQVLRYDANARRLKRVPTPPLAPLSDLLQATSGVLVMVGARGAAALPLLGSPAPTGTKPP